MTDGSTLQKRSVLISGHATSVSLEEEFWVALKRVSTDREQSINELISELDRNRVGNLSSTIRVFVLRQFSSEG
ncbi:MAG: ribbon-helix-helix domain-containing protein [Alphaproteobacteria bacterium]|nr:ribbon-helix-helix domain-containing protein [Alphaproteobacteria bacterium]